MSHYSAQVDDKERDYDGEDEWVMDVEINRDGGCE